MPISEIPVEHIYGYDYCSTSWRAIACQRSGETIIARGEQLATQSPLLPGAQSGGQVLGSSFFSLNTMLDRVKIRIPKQSCSGAKASWGYSGEETMGAWIGANISGQMPFNGGGCLASGFGYFVPTGETETIYIDDLSDIRVCVDTAYSGTIPIMVLGETIPCG